MSQSLASAEPTPSTPLYYVKNFSMLTDTVIDMYGDLLNDDELVFAETCRSMDRPALRLFLRMVSRVGNFFRSDKLSYAEIPDLKAAVHTLAELGWLRINPPGYASDLLVSLLKSELIELLANQADASNVRRIHLKKELLKQAKTLSDEAIQAYCNAKFDWYVVGSTHVLALFKLLFFGNGYQDLTEFITSDLGIKRYESVPIRRSHRYFHTREQIENALHYRYLQQLLERPLTSWLLDDLEALVQHLPETFDHPYLERRKGKICNTVGYFLEKNDRKQAAMHAYSLTDMPPARERFIRLQIDRGDWESALLQAILLQRTAIDDAECQYAIRAKRQIQNYLRMSPDFVASQRWPVYEIYVDQKPDETIEAATIRALGEQGRDAFFAENRFWLNLLGLTFWDIVFMDLPGAFLNPFQRGPVDLWLPDFARRRASAIDARLKEMADRKAWFERMQKTFAAKQGIQNDLVAWSRVNWDHIKRVAKAIKQDAFILIFERLIKNLKYYKVGMPDLIVFKKSRMQLVEVKSRNDRLSAYQIGWLTFLHQNEIPCAVAKALPKKEQT